MHGNILHHIYMMHAMRSKTNGFLWLVRHRDPHSSSYNKRRPKIIWNCRWKMDPRRYHHYQHPVHPQQHRRHGKADGIRLLNGCGTRQLATISSPVVVFQKFSAAHTHAPTQRPTNRPKTYFLRRPVEWTAEAVSLCSALGDVPPEIYPFYGNGSAVRFRT